MFSKAHDKQLKKITAYQEVFNSEMGKIVLYDLMKAHYMLSSSFDENVTQHARKEGERNVVLRILATLQVDATELAKKYKDLREKEDAYQE